MSKAKFEWMEADRRRVEFKSWEPWLKRVAKHRAAFADVIDDDPMHYNETASVGVLASAASSVGLLSIAEYVCIKRVANDRRRRKSGRADLWVYDAKFERSWAFEAKQYECRPGVKLKTLEAKLQKAADEADLIPHWEAEDAFGILILLAPTGPIPKPLMDKFDELAKVSSLAGRLTGCGRSIYIFFRKAR
jgi:hypothetical protein